ncbi:MAG TPA: 4-hydroxy-3-methylbut-2-enyl diphosphate reductase [Gaiellales bacterium]|nr:4-hydroxy-3-methylbut-2-enyl diphosphate reductase [Gaiellales bacterium]
MSGLLVAAPLRIEELALRSGGLDAELVHTGMGPRRSLVAGQGLACRPSPAGFAVAGLCAAVSPRLRPGDVVLASRLETATRGIDLPSSVLLEEELERRGLRVHRGPVRCLDHVASAEERAGLAGSGAIAVDMESAWLLEWCDDLPRAVLRVVVEPAGRGLRSPHVAADGVRGLRSLRAAAGALDAWGRALAGRSVLRAGPRSFCAGVDRAIEIVERALERRGPPVFVRKQIVHNAHVVADLEERGAVFVDEIGDVPRGATVVFSAHGVAPAVRSAAAKRDLDVIDATCPLVAKVHAEARRFVERGDSVVLIGHEGHEEVEGTIGEAPGAIHLVERPEHVARLDLGPGRVSYLTQTTLAVDETDEVVSALRDRFSDVAGPPSDDICYATHNRQQALRNVARRADLVLVVGSETSSNSKRLVEVAGREQTPARLIDDERQIRLEWLEGVRTVGLTAGASAPEQLVSRVVDALGELGAVTAEDVVVTRETTSFRLPREVR